jgi:hypothetical protein
MRKKSHKLVKSILNEAWEIPDRQTALERLSPEQRAHFSSLESQGRIHPDGHPHGWRPGTGPLYGRDFWGRNNQYYADLHKTSKQWYIKHGDSPQSAHEKAYFEIQREKTRIEKIGKKHHKKAMDVIRQGQAKQKSQTGSGQQSSSGEAPKASSSRPRSGAEIGQEIQAHDRLQNWPHIKHPQDVLGLKLSREKIERGKIKIEPLGQFNDADKKIAAVREAHARLSEIHHPDNGGDPATHRMIQDALAHYERGHALHKEAEEADAAIRKRRAEKETWPHSETPHEVLGLKPNASREEIRNAHRALSRKYHPDLNTAPDAGERFMKITQAHDWLTRDLNEWVIMMVDWVSKRYKK